MTGIETGSIYVSKTIEQDLLRFNYKNFESFEGNTLNFDFASIFIYFFIFYSSTLKFVINRMTHFSKKSFFGKMVY